MSNLRDHAEREMKLAGVDNDIYGDLVSKAVLELIDTFAKQGHSGMSGALVLSIFNQVVDFKNLTPLTNDPEEWQFHNYVRPLWQNRRCSEAFSYDGGKTYYLNSERKPGEEPIMHTSQEKVTN